MMKASHITRMIPLLISVFVLVIALYFFATGKQSYILNNPLVGKPAPLETLQGLEPRSGAYMVNFFASWCPPCREEHALLVQESDLPIVGIAYKDTPEKIDAFLEKDGDPYHAVILDAEGEIAIEWGVTGTPETFFVGADGIVKDHAPLVLTEKRLKKIKEKYFTP